MLAQAGTHSHWIRLRCRPFGLAALPADSLSCSCKKGSKEHAPESAPAAPVPSLRHVLGVAPTGHPAQTALSRPSLAAFPLRARLRSALPGGLKVNGQSRAEQSG